MASKIDRPSERAKKKARQKNNAERRKKLITQEDKMNDLLTKRNIMEKQLGLYHPNDETPDVTGLKEFLSPFQHNWDREIQLENDEEFVLVIESTDSTNSKKLNVFVHPDTTLEVIDIDIEKKYIFALVNETIYLLVYLRGSSIYFAHCKKVSKNINSRAALCNYIPFDTIANADYDSVFSAWVEYASGAKAVKLEKKLGRTYVARTYTPRYASVEYKGERWSTCCEGDKWVHKINTSPFDWLVNRVNLGLINY